MTAEDEDAGLPPLLVERLRHRPEARALVRAVLAAAESRAGGTDVLRGWAEAFDAAARLSPEAAVAVYSLGDPAVLADATAEIVHWLDRRGLIGADRAILDLGCGIGRISAALASRAALVLGVDISEEMLRLARARVREASFARLSGRDLAALRSASFDLVLVVDALPYAVDAGIVTGVVGEIGRVLRPGGDTIVLNWSYRGDPAQDRTDCERLSAAAGFDVIATGERPFVLWDGTAFHLRKPA